MTSASNRYFIEHAPAPCELVSRCTSSLPHPDDIPSFLFAVLFAMFLHAGWLHIIGNMLFLWVFGNNVEDHLGHVGYLLFYLVGGFAASFAHIAFNLDSIAPTVGASGAVAAVMGAYLVLYPKARVNVIVPIFFIFTVTQLSALVVLAFWFLSQFFIGAQEVGTGGDRMARSRRRLRVRGHRDLRPRRATSPAALGSVSVLVTMQTHGRRSPRVDRVLQGRPPPIPGRHRPRNRVLDRTRGRGSGCCRADAEARRRGRVVHGVRIGRDREPR